MKFIAANQNVLKCQMNWMLPLYHPLNMVTVKGVVTQWLVGQIVAKPVLRVKTLSVQVSPTNLL